MRKLKMTTAFNDKLLAECDKEIWLQKGWLIEDERVEKIFANKDYHITVWYKMVQKHDEE